MGVRLAAWVPAFAGMTNRMGKAQAPCQPPASRG